MEFDFDTSPNQNEGNNNDEFGFSEPKKETNPPNNEGFQNMDFLHEDPFFLGKWKIPLLELLVQCLSLYELFDDDQLIPVLPEAFDLRDLRVFILPEPRKDGDIIDR